MAVPIIRIDSLLLSPVQVQFSARSLGPTLNVSVFERSEITPF
jgi:hypothetical protein